MRWKSLLTVKAGDDSEECLNSMQMMATPKLREKKK